MAETKEVIDGRWIMKHLRVIILIIILSTGLAYAADTKLTDLTLLGSAACSDDEMIYVVDEPNGVAVDRKIARYEFLLGWAGSANITTLGTIVTGTWAATDVGVAYGGTGVSTLTDGGVLLGSGAAAITAMGALADGSIIVGDGATDPVALAVFTNSTGDLKHEAGGIEADISAIDDGGMLVGTGAGTMAIRASFMTAGAAGFVKQELGGIEADISAIADGGMLVGTGAGAMAVRASFMTAGAAGTITHELGGLQADVSGWTGLFGITGADTTVEVDTFGELDTAIADKALVNKADGAVWLGTHDYGGADLELPQASPAVPAVDGGIEIDFTDGKVVIQHGSAHAELASATDVVVGTLIKSWSGTIFEPDGVNDVLTIKAVNSIEFPHGVVITAVYLGVSSDDAYVLTVQNFDDFDTINGAEPTIDTVTYVADTTGEIIDTAPTYDTIAAGQIIMLSIPVTDVDWIHFEIYYYEPAA